MGSTDPPRVFHLITRLLKGGAEAKTIETVLGLDGYEFTVGHGADFEKSQVERLEDDGVRTHRFPLIRHYNPVTTLPAVASLARYLRQEEFDIVHTHSTEAGIIGRFAAAIAGIDNVVHTVHGVPFTEDRNPTLNRFILACERRAATHTDRIVTNADVIAEEYLKREIGTREQYTTIYSGVSLNDFRDSSPAKDLPGTRPRVVMLARLAEGKGFDDLLNAAQSLTAFNGSICIVGDGPLYTELQREIAKRGLSEFIFLTGFREDVANVLAASDILVLPSYREGTPRVITEAMASGLPVIATNIAGIPEQVVDGETGYLIPAGDVDALVSRIQYLLQNPEQRRQMGKEGLKRVDKFSVERMLDDLDRLYKQLL